VISTVCVKATFSLGAVQTGEQRVSIRESGKKAARAFAITSEFLPAKFPQQALAPHRWQCGHDFVFAEMGIICSMLSIWSPELFSCTVTNRPTTNQRDFKSPIRRLVAPSCFIASHFARLL